MLYRNVVSGSPASFARIIIMNPVWYRNFFPLLLFWPWMIFFHFQELFPEGQSQSRYSRTYRINVMRHLVLNNIGVTETAAMFSMPRRTVYDWLLRYSEAKIRLQKRQSKSSELQVWKSEVTLNCWCPTCNPPSRRSTSEAQVMWSSVLVCNCCNEKLH